MDDAEAALFSAAVRQAIGKDGHAMLSSDQLGALGWVDALDDDPASAVRSVFGLLGECNASSSALNDVVAAPLLEALESADQRGQSAKVVVLPPPGHNAVPASVLEGGAVCVRGMALGWSGQQLIVPSRLNRALAVVVLDAGSPVEGRAVDVMDPNLGLFEVRADVPAAVAAVSGPVAAAAWRDAVAAGRRALAAQLNGGVRHLLGLAIAYAQDRTQFGRPIGSFQAVKHRLAETHVALEAASAAEAAAWDAPGPGTALMAKLLAAKAANLAGKNCLQVFGGIGFTWEHPLHYYVKRAMLLEQLLGTLGELRGELARAIEVEGIVRLVEL